MLVIRYVGCAGFFVVGLFICCVVVVGLVVVVVWFDVLFGFDLAWVLVVTLDGC